MGFLIRWKDNNVAEEGHHIYRAQTSMAGLDASQLPAPYATVGPDVTEFEDGEVTPGETYFYRIGAFTASGAVVLVGDEYEAVAEEGSVYVTIMFPLGEYGALFDLQDPSTLFQDDAATQPVTADGQEVAVVQDISGNNNHAWQDVTGERPIYRTDGTFHWLDMSGGRWLRLGNHTIDDHMLAVCYDTLGDTDGIFWCKVDGTDGWRYIFDDGSTGSSAETGTSLTSMHVDGVAKSTGANRDTMHTYLAGKHVTVWQSTTSSPETLNASFGEYPSTNAGIFDLGGRVFFLAWRTTHMDDTARAALESEIAANTGVTL